MLMDDKHPQCHLKPTFVKPGSHVWSKRKSKSKQMFPFSCSWACFTISRVWTGGVALASHVWTRLYGCDLDMYMWLTYTSKLSQPRMSFLVETISRNKKMTPCKYFVNKWPWVVPRTNDGYVHLKSVNTFFFIYIWSEPWCIKITTMMGNMWYKVTDNWVVFTQRSKSVKWIHKTESK